MHQAFNIAQIQQHFENQPCFSRQELWDFYQQVEINPHENTFRWWIYNLRQKKIINTLSKTTFSLYSKPLFIPPLITKQTELYQLIAHQFPHLKCCIWTTQWLNELMLHQSSKHITIIETEGNTAESVFYFLKDNGTTNLYIQPNQKEVAMYIAENEESMVVQSLKTKAPLQVVQQVTVPTLEKILADIFADKVLFNAFQGSELDFIFNTAYQKYELNLTKLLHYASRRGKKEELLAYLRTRTNIPILND